MREGGRRGGWLGGWVGGWVSGWGWVGEMETSEREGEGEREGERERWQAYARLLPVAFGSGLLNLDVCGMQLMRVRMSALLLGQGEVHYSCDNLEVLPTIA